MIISKYDSGLLHSCMYIVEENGHALVIDPCEFITPAYEYIFDYILITHEHYDHISGVNAWKNICKAPLLCSRQCAKNINNSKKNMSRYFDVFCEMQSWIPFEEIKISPVEYICEADITFEDKVTLDWQGHKVSLIEIPGHSLGSIGIDIDGKDFFSGDSLLENDEIELRLPGGSVKRWEEIGKKRIEDIPKGTRIWPGHFESFILKNQNKP